MTTATLSAYPRALDELLIVAREHVSELGGVPSRNQLMRQYRIGAPKASELRELLLAEFGPTVADHTPVPARPTELDPLPEPDPVTKVQPGPVIEVEPTTPDPVNEPEPVVTQVGTEVLAAPDGHPATPTVVAPVQPMPATPSAPVAIAVSPRARRKPVVWPVLLLSLPAFVAIWSGWVELGELAGFGIVHPLPGIADQIQINTAITLPIGVETYAAYALWVWLSGRAPRAARRFAKWSALGSLVFGAAGQIAYHLLAAAGVTAAPWQITSAVACLPVAVLGMGAALAHLMHANEDD